MAESFAMHRDYGTAAKSHRQTVTRTLVLNEGSPQQKREELLHYFQSTFDQYDLLFETLNCDAAWFEKAIPLRHPLIFYYGHTAAVFVNKLITAKLIDQRLDPNMESTVAVGVDEMSWDDLDEQNYRWPTVNEVRTYQQNATARSYSLG